MRNVSGEIVAANFPSDFFSVLFMARMHDDLRALSSEGTGNAQPNVMSRSRNQRNFVLQQHKSIPFSKKRNSKAPSKKTKNNTRTRKKIRRAVPRRSYFPSPRCKRSSDRPP